MIPQKTDVPVFILAGGKGTRIADESDPRPKPMIEIGGIPILLHIMRWYHSHGFNDFVILAGYRSYDIKNYFLNYQFRSNDLLIDHRESTIRPAEPFHSSSSVEKWRVRVIDTGLETMTGGRVARAFDIISKDQKFSDFGLTYGDGVSDVDLTKEFDFHQSHGRVGSVLGVKPLARFGELEIKDDATVTGFLEKPQATQGFINGGFFFFKNKFRNYIDTDASLILEQSPLAKLASDGELKMYKHSGFWQPMDTPRDKNLVTELWESGKAPWYRPMGSPSKL